MKTVPASPTIVQANTFGPLVNTNQIEEILALPDPASPDKSTNLARVLLSLFLDLPPEALTEEVLKRYIEITTEETHLSIVPYTTEINNRLLRPLCSARRNYACGDYIASIAVSGLAAEMLAILLWKMNAENLQTRGVTANNEREILGYSFERLGQERRTQVLRAYGFVDTSQYAQFRRILGERSKHMHSWDVDPESEKSSARVAVQAASSLFKSMAAVEFIDAGNVKVNPLLQKFFDEENRRLNRALPVRHVSK